MLTLLAAWRWLQSLPRIVLVITGSVIALAIAAWAIYHAGAVHEQRTLHRHALADSIHQETIVHTADKAHTDSTRAVAKFAKKQSDSSHVRWETARADVAKYLDSLPKPVVDLIHIGDQMERRDVTTITAYVALDTASLQERASGERLDTLQQHQAAVGVEPTKQGHGKLIVGTVIVTTVAVKFGPAIVHALLHALHR